MGWLAAGGWVSAALTATVLGWLLEKARRQRDGARAEAAAHKRTVDELAQQLADVTATAKEQITRLEEGNRVLRKHFKSALEAMEALALAHPGTATDLLRSVFQDAAEAGATDPGQHASLPRGATPKPPRTGN